MTVKMETKVKKSLWKTKKKAQTFLKKPITELRRFCEDVVVVGEIGWEWLDWVLAYDSNTVLEWGVVSAVSCRERGNDEEDGVEVRHKGGEVDGLAAFLEDEDADVVADVAFAVDELGIVWAGRHEGCDMEHDFKRCERRAVVGEDAGGARAVAAANIEPACIATEAVESDAVTEKVEEVLERR